MTKGKEKKKKKREHLGRPPKTVRAYTRATLEKLFVPGKEYTMAYICEQLDEKVPTNVRMRTRFWDQMGLAGAVWERVQGSKYYLYKGLKDKPKNYGNYYGSMCAKKRIIDTFGINEQGYSITDYLSYNNLCRIYYQKDMSQILLSRQGVDKDSIEFKALTTLNRIIRNRMYRIFWKDLDGWKNNTGHPELNVLIPERRNNVDKRYRYYNVTEGKAVISDLQMTEEIEKRCKKGIDKNKLLYGKRNNPFAYLKKQGIEVYGTVWKIQFVKDVPDKYYCDENGLQRTLEKRLQKNVYKYLKSEWYGKEIYIEDEYDRNTFDILIWNYYDMWRCKYMKYALTNEELQDINNMPKITEPLIKDNDNEIICIGENEDIEKNEDFITYEYEYEIIE